MRESKIRSKIKIRKRIKSKIKSKSRTCLARPALSSSAARQSRPAASGLSISIVFSYFRVFVIQASVNMIARGHHSSMSVQSRFHLGLNHENTKVRKHEIGSSDPSDFGENPGHAAHFRSQDDADRRWPGDRVRDHREPSRGRMTRCPTWQRTLPVPRPHVAISRMAFVRLPSY